MKFTPELSSHCRMGTDIVSILTHHIISIRLTFYLSLASAVFRQYDASDDASESFASLKRIHGLMPYFMFKAAQDQQSHKHDTRFALSTEQPTGFLNLLIRYLGPFSCSTFCWKEFIAKVGHGSSSLVR